MSLALIVSVIEILVGSFVFSQRGDAGASKTLTFLFLLPFDLPRQELLSLCRASEKAGFELSLPLSDLSEQSPHIGNPAGSFLLSWIKRKQEAFSAP